ncbi:MAG: helix-turn-helix domain-containing protein [Acidobacteria bacterium]|jgi:excisionase family DNA binding protein|nr:helix-turn-helix domain-containing protein [Acidobacteriota bacterium]
MTSHIRVQRVCNHCGDEFTAKTTVTQYCGDVCAKQAYKARSRQAKIEHSEAETTTIRNKPLAEIQAKEFLSVTETCALLGLSRRTVFRLLQSGRIPAVKFGRRTIIKRANLEALFGSSVVEGVKADESVTQREKDFRRAQEPVSGLLSASHTA